MCTQHKTGNGQSVFLFQNPAERHGVQKAALGGVDQKLRDDGQGPKAALLVRLGQRGNLLVISAFFFDVLKTHPGGFCRPSA